MASWKCFNFVRLCGGLFEIWSHINGLIEALNSCAAECNGGVFKMWPVTVVFMESLKGSEIYVIEVCLLCDPLQLT
jgi:hypothetical protein